MSELRLFAIGEGLKRERGLGWEVLCVCLICEGVEVEEMMGGGELSKTEY